MNTPFWYCQRYNNKNIDTYITNTLPLYCNKHNKITDEQMEQAGLVDWKTDLPSELVQKWNADNMSHIQVDTVWNEVYYKVSELSKKTVWALEHRIFHASNNELKAH